MLAAVSSMGGATLVAANHLHVTVVDHSNVWTDWFIPFASGVAATLLGFLFSILWERRKRELERRNLDNALITLMEEELATNLSVLMLNDAILTRELPQVDTGATQIEALCELQSRAWEAVGIDLARWVPDHQEILAHFRAAGVLSTQINSLIRDRARFRMQGIASPNYPQRMREFDEAILQKNGIVRGQLTDLLVEVRQLGITIGARKGGLTRIGQGSGPPAG